MNEPSTPSALFGGPTGFVTLLTRLGPRFREFGRFLSLRPDFLPLEFRDELLESRPVRKPALWATVRSVLEGEFPDLDAAFESIDPAPLFCLPLCQFHRAVTRDGSAVLVKILLPDAPRHLRRTRLFIHALGWSRSGFFPAKRELTAEWKQWCAAELDLTAELASLMRQGESVGPDSPLRVPRAFPELCTPRVLTFQDLGGIPLIDVLVPARHAEALPENDGFDAHSLATRLLETTVRGIFGQNRYNAAVDPRGILILPGNCFSFLNFSHCESMDSAAARLHVRFLKGVFRTELPAVFRILESLLVPGDSSDAESLRGDFVQDSHQWLRGDSTLSPRRGTRTYGSPLSTWLLAVLRSARRNGFRPPHEMLAAYRTLISVEWITSRLDSGVHLQSAGLEYLADIELDEALRILEPQVQNNALSDLLAALAAAPEHLRQVLSDSVSGRLTANLNAAPDALSGGTRDRRTNMIVAAVAAVAAAWAIGERSLRDIAPVAIAAPLLASLYLYIAVQWRGLGK